MKKLLKLAAVILFAVAVVCTTGCKKSSDNDDNNNSGGGTVTPTCPTGAINGLFSVSANKKVYFSQGNLQYQASTNTWRFAENQWDYVGGIDYNTNVKYGNVFENGIQCDNTLASSSYNGWIDLFGWGTSSYNHGAICYQPWSYPPVTSYPQCNEYYYAYGSIECNLFDRSGKADWGYNRISNGGNQENCWRTLTHDEWEYILKFRDTPSRIRYTKAIVNGVEGLILLPDNWNETYYSFYDFNGSYHPYSINIISQTSWISIFEKHGAIFLPSAGDGGIGGQYWNTRYDDRFGEYWMSDVKPQSYYPYNFAIVSDNLFPNDICTVRMCGESVRLVQDYQ